MVLSSSSFPTSKGQWPQGCSHNEDKGDEDNKVDEVADDGDGADNAEEDEQLVSRPRAMTLARRTAAAVGSFAREPGYFHLLTSMHFLTLTTSSVGDHKLGKYFIADNKTCQEQYSVLELEPLLCRWRSSWVGVWVKSVLQWCSSLLCYPVVVVSVPMLLRIILGSSGLPEEGGAVVYHEAKVGLGRQRLQQAAGQVQIMQQACKARQG